MPYLIQISFIFTFTLFFCFMIPEDVTLHLLVCLHRLDSFSQTLMTLTALRSTSQEFCRLIHNWNLSDVSPMICQVSLLESYPLPSFHPVLFGRESLPSPPFSSEKPVQSDEGGVVRVCKMNSTSLQDRSLCEKPGVRPLETKDPPNSVKSRGSQKSVA